MKTSELSGKALDYAVAKCIKPEWLGNQAEVYVLQCEFNPSSNWSQGGPIIERERIELIGFHRLDARKHGVIYQGKTSLVAAMRCFVASKLGECVDIPEELL